MKITAVLIAVLTVLCGCLSAEAADLYRESAFENYDGEPYVVKTILHEDAAIDPNTGIGLYIRYTELKVEGEAPDTFKKCAEDCNRRAEEAALKRINEVRGSASGQMPEDITADRDNFETCAYIVTVTRADSTAFSFLETEYEESVWDPWYGSEVSYLFRGTTFETVSGNEISLYNLVKDEETCTGMIREALQSKYGIEGLADTKPEDFTWTLDALGIRFYFNSEAVSKEKRHEINDYTNTAITVAFPYDVLTGEKAEILSCVPEAYIAMMERETVYDLPYGDLSVMITEKDGETVIRMMPDDGEESDLIIEYADNSSDFYIMRSEGGFYLFREGIARQEAYMYDFDRPDGGFGRFACKYTQYFDSFLREIRLALPYNPYCVHMCEIRRSFGKTSYDDSSFIPHGHYSFPDDPEGRYKCFLLLDDSLQIDTGNVACRLLEDMPVTVIDDEGNETGEIFALAGDTMVFETVAGQASKYQTPDNARIAVTEFIYDCRLSDGSKVRFTSDTESTVSLEGNYMNRFTEPVSLAEAKAKVTPKEQEVFTVRIGDKDYPVISDYSQKDHAGEEIDFGDDIWWLVEGYTGRYEMTEEDRLDMENGWNTYEALSHTEGTAVLEICEDGWTVFDYFGEIFEGWLPDSRYYKRDVEINMKSDKESRTFRIILREGDDHTVPEKIELYSEGLPATNEPSTVPPISVYLTRKMMIREK